MKRIIFLLLVAAVGLAAVNCSRTDEQEQKIARGKYIVESVGMCADCHTPRNERGEFDQARWLQGSQLFIAPTVPIPNWAGGAPRIAGLPRLSEADVTSLLEKGTTTQGWSPRPPMPPFRMAHEDAAAVAAYLKSLGDKAGVPLTSQNR
ncbi:MAG TPA: c-type cytochrome [Blastocatellia bacterium]|nr:c-type cytochrome [Blastocatellia bacterium]